MTYTVTSGVTEGTTYSFKIRSKNKWGWGAYSVVPLTKLAAIKPSQVAKPVTSIDATAGGVKIVWTEPASNGAAITAYDIQILKKDGTTWITETTCDGTVDPILSQKWCIVAMSKLYSATYLLLRGDTVKVQIAATNSISIGDYSPASDSAALVRTVPAVVVLPTRGSTTSET